MTSKLELRLHNSIFDAKRFDEMQLFGINWKVTDSNSWSIASEIMNNNCLCLVRFLCNQSQLPLKLDQRLFRLREIVSSNAVEMFYLKMKCLKWRWNGMLVVVLYLN